MRGFALGGGDLIEDRAISIRISIFHESDDGLLLTFLY